MPFELEIGGGYSIVIPDRINIGSSGLFIPIPHRRILFYFIRGVILLFIALVLAYRNNFWVIPKNSSFIVAQDGSGDFATVSAAVAAAPDHRRSYFRIYIKGGTYVEHVKVGQAKTHIELIGDGVGKTIISFNLSQAELNRTYSAATVYVRGDDFLARDITFINTAEPDRGGAPAFTSEGNRTVLYRCRFTAYWATVYARSGYQFYRECEIFGTTNIIFGSARAAVFQNCMIFAGKPFSGHRITITAHPRSSSIGKEMRSTFSLHNCTITTDPGVGRSARAGLRGHLGIPWPASSETVVMQSFLDKVIHRQGWLQSYYNGPSGFYGEYDNRGPGAKRLQSSTLGQYSINITAQAAQNFTVAELLIHGDTWLHRTRVTYKAALI